MPWGRQEYVRHLTTINVQPSFIVDIFHVLGVGTGHLADRRQAPGVDGYLKRGAGIQTRDEAANSREAEGTLGMAEL
jgi:hypothetical protein